MKSNFSRSLTCRFLSKSIASLLVAAMSALPLLAQSVDDASTFPKLEDLPGKHPPQVWTGLAAKWAQRHQAWKGSASNDVGAVVFLGDSITEGWSMLAQDFPNIHVANRGIGGDITSGVLYRLKADVLNLKPKAIVLLIGTNDLGNNGDPADVASNIQLILEAIKAYDPKLKVIVCKIMPRNDRGVTTYAAKIKTVNSAVEQYVAGNPKFLICDTWSGLADENGQPKPEDYVPDHLHLNRNGYAVWKAALEPVLAKAGLNGAKAQ